ncbi:hypothetical protein M3Y95_00003600 [Aphelenchoides besseyi]|nr:hypothetical protein M3Y95_00003600 [Aphelenchoides besseyi]
MIQLLAYFFFNCLGFFVFYGIWLCLTKPEPYDYTTIPGLKCEELSLARSAIVIPIGVPINTISKSTGNLPEIQQHKHVNLFLKWLNEMYGPLAAFHWGPRYTIAVGTLELVRELQSQLRSMNTELNPLLYASVLFGSTFAWNDQSESVAMDDDRNDDLKAAQMQAMLFQSYDVDEAEEIEKMRKPRGWIDGPLVVVFNEDIELQAHPIPAHVPILLNVSLMLEGCENQGKALDLEFGWLLKEHHNQR